MLIITQEIVSVYHGPPSPSKFDCSCSPHQPKQQKRSVLERSLLFLLTISYGFNIPRCRVNNNDIPFPDFGQQHGLKRAAGSVLHIPYRNKMLRVVCDIYSPLFLTGLHVLIGQQNIFITFFNHAEHSLPSIFGPVLRHPFISQYYTHPDSRIPRFQLKNHLGGDEVNTILPANIERAYALLYHLFDLLFQYLF